MRHSEAEGASALGDAARALTPRGQEDCRRLGEKLVADGAAWDALLCSSARRAQQSAQCMAAALAPAPEIDIREELNLAGADALLAALRALPDEVRSVLLVAHNPGIHALVLLLAGRGGSRAARKAARDFPPGALARFAYDAESWARLAPGAADLRDFLTPRDLD
jgi:phosphohistidine phosphatase